MKLCAVVWCLIVCNCLKVGGLAIREKRDIGTDAQDDRPLLDRLIKRDVSELTDNNKIFVNPYSPSLPLHQGNHVAVQTRGNSNYDPNTRMLSDGRLCKPKKTFIQHAVKGSVVQELCEPIENPYEATYSSTSTPNDPVIIQNPPIITEIPPTIIKYPPTIIKSPPTFNAYLPPDVASSYLPPVQEVTPQYPSAGFGAPYIDPISRTTGENPCPDGTTRDLAGNCV